MISRRAVLACALSLAAVSTAKAATRLPYSQNGFDEARQAGKPILVHVTAPWCGECKLQKPIVARLMDRADFQNLVVFDVDFDSQKDALRHLNVRKQATLVVFKAQEEVGRLVGVTKADAIEALMKKAI